MQYVTATGKLKHWSNIADGGGKDQLCPMVKPSFWARLSLLVFFLDFGVWVADGGSCANAVGTEGG
jgi:hypothetical protein